jgi:hypothetical protein
MLTVSIAVMKLELRPRKSTPTAKVVYETWLVESTGMTVGAGEDLNKYEDV